MLIICDFKNADLPMLSVLSCQSVNIDLLAVTETMHDFMACIGYMYEIVSKINYINEIHVYMCAYS